MNNLYSDFLQRVSERLSLIYGSGKHFLIVGMGKTIMLSALIQTSLPVEEAEEEATLQSKGKQLRLNNAFRPVRHSNKHPSATLVVAPTSLLHQWEDELKRSSKPGTFDIFVWHGQNRLHLEDILENDEHDRGIKIVITSYGVLSSEHAKMDRQVFDSE
jgi:DNA repair protein RAD5